MESSSSSFPPPPKRHHSLPQHPPPSTPPPPPPAALPTPPKFSSGSETIFRILCPATKTGAVIGRGGSTVRHLREETGARIRVVDDSLPPHCDERVILITAPSSSSSNSSAANNYDGECEIDVRLVAASPSPAQTALVRVLERILRADDERSDKGGEDHRRREEGAVGGEDFGVCRLLAPSHQVGCVLGRGGKIVERIRQESGAQIRVFPREHIPACASPGDELIQVEMSQLEAKVNQLQNELEEIRNGKGAQRGRTELSEKKDAPVDPVDLQRRERVKEAMLHAWSSYEKYAWGQDELQPQTKSGINSFGGLGATLIDSLDTLYIMGLDEQFQKAREWVATTLDFHKDYAASVFETTIRVVGGLLSAYDLSEDKVFLEKAKDIADRLLPAWDTPSGVPNNIINLAHGRPHNPGWTGGASILADSGTEQLEFIALSQRTGDPKYQQKAEKVIEVLNRTFPSDGLLPIYINPDSGISSRSTITFGAMGDSFYEYLLKVWIQGNKTAVVKPYRVMWETSMKGLESLVRRSTPSNFTYICEKHGNSLSDKMDELACFAPGMLALGSLSYGPGEAEKFLSLAEELAWTCYNFYQLTPTKLAGENYFFHSGQDMSVGTSWNIMRPETVESLFYLWRITGNKTYQEWGWNIFQAFEKNSRIESGYVGLKDVNTGVKDNMMQSFFLAETLKYLYLLFSPPSVISLDEWVFNTEAHPLKIVTRHNTGVQQYRPVTRRRGRKEGRTRE